MGHRAVLRPYLDGLERVIHEAIPPTTRKAREAKVHLIRYADDFLITGSTKELLEQAPAMAVTVEPESSCERCAASPDDQLE